MTTQLKATANLALARFSGKFSDDYIMTLTIAYCNQFLYTDKNIYCKLLHKL